MPKIFIAGHLGLVGSAILRRIEKERHTNLLLRSHRQLDLTKQAQVNAFFEKERPECVYLAAARVGGIWANDNYPADFIRDNLLIEANIIDAAYRSGVKKLLFLGSSCIYPKLSPQPMKEKHLFTGPLEPTNEWYAIAKIAGIKMCQAYRRQHSFNAISLMPTNLYGPGDNFDLEKSHVLPALIRKFHLAKLAYQGDLRRIEQDEHLFGPIPEPLRSSLCPVPSDLCLGSSPSERSGHPSVTLWGTGTPRREFLHVDDLADACVFLMEHYDSEEIVNVGVGEDLTIENLAEMVKRVVGFKGEIAWDGSKPDGTPRKLLDTSRLTSLGWRPRITLEDGIRQTYEWYKNHVRGHR